METLQSRSSASSDMCGTGLANDDQSQVQDQRHHPLFQVPDSLTRFFSSVMSVAIRTDVRPLSVVEALQRQARGSSGDQALYEVRTMHGTVGQRLAGPAAFSFVALWNLCSGPVPCMPRHLRCDRVPHERARTGVRRAHGAGRKHGECNAAGLASRFDSGSCCAGLASTSLAAGRALQRMVAGMPGPDPVVYGAMLCAFCGGAPGLLFARPACRESVDPMVASLPIRVRISHDRLPAGCASFISAAAPEPRALRQLP